MNIVFTQHCFAKITWWYFLSEYVLYNHFLIKFLMKYQRNKWIINIYVNGWYISTYWYHCYRLPKRKNRALSSTKMTINEVMLLWNFKLQCNCVRNYFIYFLTLGNIVPKNCQRNHSRVTGIIFLTYDALYWYLYSLFK